MNVKLISKELEVQLIHCLFIAFSDNDLRVEFLLMCFADTDASLG